MTRYIYTLNKDYTIDWNLLKTIGENEEYTCATNEIDSKDFPMPNGLYLAKWDSEKKQWYEGNPPKVDIEALKADKIRYIKETCKEKIHAGFDSTYKDGTIKHYSLSDDTQRTMDSLAKMIREYGAKVVPFRDDSLVMCEPYQADTYMKIYNRSSKFVLESRYYSDGLEKLAKAAGTREELDAIQWGITLPKEIQDFINSIIACMGIWVDGTDEVVQKVN